MSKIIDNLIANYNNACEKLIKKFVQKHKYEFAYSIGSIYCFIDQYYFDIDDIIYDLKEDLPKDLIFQWQDDSIKAYEVNGQLNKISLENYSKGVRYSDFL